MTSKDEIVARLRSDRRRFRRVSVDKPGKLYLPKTTQELACFVINMSPGGALLQCDYELKASEQVVLYVDGIGRYEGMIVRVDEEGEGVRFTSTPLKRERTAEQLTVYLNRDLIDENTLRRHERITVTGSVSVTRPGGKILVCEGMDLSLSGISLRTEEKPPVGEFVLIGPLAARVARHHADGIGLEFLGITFTSPEAVQRKLSL